MGRIYLIKKEEEFNKKTFYGVSLFHEKEKIL
jgi:hypothetical protein